MPTIRVVANPKTWAAFTKMCEEKQDHFLFLPKPVDGGVQWIRSLNGGPMQPCNVGIPVDELTKMANKAPTPGTSKATGPKLHGTISSSLLDRIPVEIFDHIIDHIPYSHLPVAALVARSWYASVVHNLYRIVELDSREEFNSLAMQLHKSARVQRWAASTEELVIGRPLSKAHTGPTAYLDVIPAVLSGWLPSLRKLTIQSELRSRMQPVFYVVLQQFQQLVSLRLTDAELDSTMSLVRVIRCFPLLKFLALARLQIADKEPPAQPRAPCCDAIRLKSLTLEFVEGKSLEKIVDMLVSSEMCTQLERFTVALKGVVREPLQKPTSPELEGGQIERILKESGPALKSFCEQNDPAYGLGFPHLSLENNTDLRYLNLQIYVSLDVDVVSPNIYPEIRKKLAQTRVGLHIPAQFGLAEKWARGAQELRAELMAVRSDALEHLVVHVNLTLFDLYLKQDVRACMDMIANRMHAKPRPHDAMRRRCFDRLRRVDVILDMRHDQLSHDLCAKYTPTSVDPVVRELFKPWCERGIVKLSKMFLLNE